MLNLKVSVSGFSMLYKPSGFSLVVMPVFFFSMVFGYIYAGHLFNGFFDYYIWGVVGIFCIVFVAFVLLYSSMLTTVDIKSGKVVVDELFVFGRKEVLLIDMDDVHNFFVESGRGFFGFFSGFVLNVVYELPEGQFNVHQLGFASELYVLEGVCGAMNDVLIGWKGRDFVG